MYICFLECTQRQLPTTFFRHRQSNVLASHIQPFTPSPVSSFIDTKWRTSTVKLGHHLSANGIRVSFSWRHSNDLLKLTFTTWPQPALQPLIHLLSNSFWTEHFSNVRLFRCLPHFLFLFKKAHLLSSAAKWYFKIATQKCSFDWLVWFGDKWKEIH